MEASKVQTLAFFVVLLLVLLPEGSDCEPIRSLPPPRPLCSSQYVLVNYACSMLPYSPRQSVLGSIASPSPEAGEHKEHDHKHGHGHGHRHRHRGRHQETPQERECCRWLREMNVECVCDLLVHLPSFLTKPFHNYTVIVDETCAITFPCAGRLIRWSY